MKNNYLDNQSFDHKAKKVTWKQKRAKPNDYGLTAESVKKQTVPGQSQTVKELMQRYEKGRPTPIQE